MAEGRSAAASSAASIRSLATESLDEEGQARASQNVPAFLLKTFEILENSENHDFVSWDASGERIVIKKVGEFSAQVLPKYFKHNNFQSFVRQLNMYSFHKIRHKSGWREFQHPMFKRGNRHLLHTIKRKTSGASPASVVRQQNQHLHAQSQEIATVATRMQGCEDRIEHVERLLSSLTKRCACLERENHYLWQAMTERNQAPGSVPTAPSGAAALSSGSLSASPAHAAASGSATAGPPPTSMGRPRRAPATRERERKGGSSDSDEDEDGAMGSASDGAAGDGGADEGRRRGRRTRTTGSARRAQTAAERPRGHGDDGLETTPAAAAAAVVGDGAQADAGESHDESSGQQGGSSDSGTRESRAVHASANAQVQAQAQAQARAQAQAYAQAQQAHAAAEFHRMFWSGPSGSLPAYTPAANALAAAAAAAAAQGMSAYYQSPAARGAAPPGASVGFPTGFGLTGGAQRVPAGAAGPDAPPESAVASPAGPDSGRRKRRRRRTSGAPGESAGSESGRSRTSRASVDSRGSRASSRAGGPASVSTLPADTSSSQARRSEGMEAPPAKRGVSSRSRADGGVSAGTPTRRGSLDDGAMGALLQASEIARERHEKEEQSAGAPSARASSRRTRR